MAKAKKMTTKEFKEVFNNSGYSFEIYGWEGILNIIAAYEVKNEKEMEQLGLTAGAKGSQRRYKAITEVLAERGFYKD